MNGMVVVVAGLIALAVANEVAIADPREQPIAVLMSGGAVAYLLAQAWYLLCRLAQCVLGRPSREGRALIA